MSSECIYTKEMITKNIEFLLERYIDAIQHSISQQNLHTKLKGILSRKFHFKIGSESGDARVFEKYIFSKQQEYERMRAKIIVKNPRFSLIKFKHGNETRTQEIHLDERFHINSINCGNKMSGGVGYTYQVGLNPVAGRPVIAPYLNCCRPIFYGSLLQNGGKNKVKESKKKVKESKKKQKGGRLNTAYYLDVAGNHFNVQPQYRQYEDLC